MKFFQVNEIVDAWAAARAHRVALDPVVDAYRESLEGDFSAEGSVHALGFELDLDPSLFEMAAHHENWKHSKILDLLWLVPGIEGGLPRLGRCREPVTDRFYRADAFELASVLGRRAWVGGPYTPMGRSLEGYLELGARTANALLLGEPVAALISESAWCGYFLDIAWDLTVVTVLPKAKQIHVLLATDCD